MTNHYLTHYQKKIQHPDLVEDEFGAWYNPLDWGVGEALNTAGGYYKKQYQRGGLTGIVTGTTSDLYTAVSDYDQTQKEARKRNEGAWERKVEIAKAFKKLGPWPAKIPKYLYQVGKAYPDAPNWSWGLAMPPNSVADAYAQGAVAAYLTAKMWNRPTFIQLGDSLLKKAEHWGKKGKKPINSDSFLVSIQPGVMVINTVSGLFQDKSGVDVTKGAPVAKVMKGIVAKWMELAYQQKILTKPTDLIGQIKNVMAGNDEKAAMTFAQLLRNNATPSEIKFSQNVAQESQASIADLAYNMRGIIGIAGIAIAGLFLYPVIMPLLPTVFSGIKKVGKGVGKGIGAVGKGAGKLITASGKKDAEEAFIAASNAAEKGNVKEFVEQTQKAQSLSPYPIQAQTASELKTMENLAAANPNAKAPPPQMKRILSQVLVESQGQRI